VRVEAGPLMPNEDPQLRGRIRLSEAPPEEQRSLFVAAVLGRPPTSPPGTAWAYSNAGYVVAGTMIERLAGAPWEELIGRELFVPLGLTSAGFGAPGTPGGALDQPWGHIPREGGFSPVQPGPWADNPPALGPAGRVHLSIGDFARYAAMHLRAARGDHSFLAEDSVARLHTPHSESGDALGWLVQARPGEEGGPLLLHDGSNGMFYALIVIAPERNRAIVLATNAGGEGAGRALAAALALFKL